MIQTIQCDVVLVISLAFHNQTEAAVVYTEAGNGELSGDSMNPTDLGFFMPGVNSVTGQVTSIGAGGFNGTADIFTFEIAAGEQLNTIVLDSFATPSGGGLFMMLDDGNTFQFTAPQINDNFNLPNLSLILGGSVVGTSNVGTDVLDNLANAVNLGLGSQFETPLGQGQYSIYLQETGPFSDYSFSFNVTAVPEPSTTFAMVLAAGLIGFRRLRKRVSRISSGTPSKVR